MPDLAGVTAIAAGCFHSLAVGQNGTVWVWGNNDYGQLGDGTTTRRNPPIPLPALTGFTAVATTATHSLALHKTAPSGPGGTTSMASLGMGRPPSAHAWPGVRA